MLDKYLVRKGVAPQWYWGMRVGSIGAQFLLILGFLGVYLGNEKLLTKSGRDPNRLVGVLGIEAVKKGDALSLTADYGGKTHYVDLREED